jgi:hypothetical protein
MRRPRPPGQKNHPPLELYPPTAMHPDWVKASNTASNVICLIRLSHFPPDLAKAFPL